MKMNKNKWGIMKMSRKANKITHKTLFGEIKMTKHMNTLFVYMQGS